MELRPTVDGRLKYVSLVSLTVQNAAQALSMRYARTRPGHMFLSSTAVLNSEIVKLIACLIMVYRDSGGWRQWTAALKGTIIDQPMDTLKVCVPALIYVIQNNLLYVATSHLDVATYQVTYQLKILTTAVFSVIILRKKLQYFQWGALLILLTGVVMVQLVETTEKHPAARGAAAGSETAGEQNRALGFTAALIASCLSGFSGIYFEKILKGSPAVSVWMRNTQLSLLSIPFAIVTCGVNDRQFLIDKGFFYGYDSFVIYLVFLQALGGLLVALVVKYADNILKGFATSLAIILACVASIIFFNFVLTAQFSVGTILVILSIFLYGYQPPPSAMEQTQPVSKV